MNCKNIDYEGERFEVPTHLFWSLNVGEEHAIIK